MYRTTSAVLSQPSIFFSQGLAFDGLFTRLAVWSMLLAVASEVGSYGKRGQAALPNLKAKLVGWFVAFRIVDLFVEQNLNFTSAS